MNPKQAARLGELLADYVIDVNRHGQYQALADGSGLERAAWRAAEKSGKALADYLASLVTREPQPGLFDTTGAQPCTVETRNIVSAHRASDQSVMVTFGSARAASQFEKEIKG